MATTHDATPVTGYRDGIIISDTTPRREATKGGDGRENLNDWFYIDGQRFNVHPYRSDFGGWPIRWTEAAPNTPAAARTW